MEGWKDGEIERLIEITMSHSCTSISTRLSSSTCILQLQSSPSPYHSGQFGERITPPGPVRSPPHCAAGDVTKEKVWFHLFLFFFWNLSEWTFF